MLQERGGLASRCTHLQTLVQQFQLAQASLGDKKRKTPGAETSRKEALAHLANFAYDPINYDFFRRLNIIELFQDAATDEDPDTADFAVAGLCNLSVDPANHALIVAGDGLDTLLKTAASARASMAVSALGTLFYLCHEKPAVLAPERTFQTVIGALSSPHVCVRNVAASFMTEHPQPPAPR